MKKYLIALLIVLVVALLVSCSSAPAYGLENAEWKLVSTEPLSATGNALGSKTGVSISIYRNSKLIPEDDVVDAGELKSEESSKLSVNYGAGIASASKAGGITKISTADTKTYKYHGFTKVECIVTGE